MFLAVTTFWGAFFLCLIWVPLAILWIGALIDVFHRDDLGGGAKALWVVAIIVLPWIGALSYLITRPTGVTPEERAAMEQTAYTPRVTPT